jgi:hypothetical protein
MPVGFASMALFIERFMSTFCKIYRIFSRWEFNEACGSCMMVPQPIAVTPPEITSRRMGRQGPAFWPGRSSDLNLLWGRTANLVYATAVDIAEELLQRFQNGCTSVRNTPV